MVVFKLTPVFINFVRLKHEDLNTENLEQILSFYTVVVNKWMEVYRNDATWDETKKLVMDLI